jgi:NAD(P)-dependent dehydrogenase (short-subunit alcohol dehydrogenase family)
MNHFFNVGIRVNATAPGFFITEQTRPLLTNEDGSLSARGKAEMNRNLALIAKTLRKINDKTLRKKLSTFNSFA